MPHSTFENFGLPPKLAQALARIKFTTPTPIQAQTIPLALKGQDVLGSAQTGTGKTGAFGIPVIAGLMERSDAAALIMTPTRELAGQVMGALEPMIPTADIRTALLIGGEAMPKQFHQLRFNPRLIVGTPGRINDHLERGTLKLDNVRFLVLDETDRMLDMGFGIQIERILKHVSADRQTLLFSATLPSNIVKLSSKYMRDPVRVAVGSTSVPLEKIKQEVIPVSDHEKYGKLIEQLDARKGSIIIFVKTKYGTEKLADKLSKNDHRADAIHGDLQQRRRERVIQNFRDKKFRILVATDVAARGLDIPHIAHVINYDMPQSPEDYIHRVGRTARADAEGAAVSFLTAADNAKWRAIQRLMNGEDPNEPQVRKGGGARRGFGGRGGRKPFGKHEGEKQRSNFGAGSDRPHEERPQGHKSNQARSYGQKMHSDRAPSDRPYSERGRSDRPYSDRARTESFSNERPRSERPYGDKPHRDRSAKERRANDYPGSQRPHSERFRGERPQSDHAHDSRSRADRPHSNKSRTEHVGGEKNSVDHRAHRHKHRSERVGNDLPRGEKNFGGKSHPDQANPDKSSGDNRFGDRPYNKPFGKKSGNAKFFRTGSPSKGRG